MPRRVKDEEKVEMIIRGLLKQPDNRRCINCNTLGPQYVCTTFWTFVCTNCSGVHRELTHRVKSVSMAKFSDEEIMSLQAGGNERAKQIYFKSWDPHFHSYPSNSNLQRLREFISSVYVDRKYTHENTSSKLSSPQSESRNNFCDWPSERSRWSRSPDSLRSPGSSSSRDEPHDYSLFERSSSGKGLHLKDFLEERSPRNNHVGMPRSSSHRSRLTRFEIIDDRYREDGSVRRYERGTGSGGRSPCSLRSPASLPGITPISAFLGDKSPELRVAEPPAAVDDHKASVGADADADKKGNEAKNVTNLIDFLDAEPEANEQTASNTTTPSTTAEATAIVPINSVESLLFEISAPTPTPSSPSVATGPSLPNATDAAVIETTEAPHQVPNNSESLAITVVESNQPLHTDDSNHMMQDVQTHHLPLPLNTLQTASSLESSLNEQGFRSPASDDLRRTRSVSSVQALEAANSSPNARKEIPEDLFTSGFPSFAPAGWPHGAAYGVQFHHPAMHVVTYQNPPRPKNPFEIDDDRFLVQAPTFPSMSPLHGAHPHMPISAASQPQPAPYLLPQPYMTSYGMNMPLVPGAYMAQLSNNMMLASPEENANFGRNEDAFASLNPITRASTSPLPRAGNPFG